VPVMPVSPQEPCGGCAPEVGNPSERVEGDRCHKKGVAHHGEQIVHVCLVWTWVGHREGLTGLFAGLVGSSGLKRVSWNVLGLRAPQRGLVGCSGLERVSFKTGA
jgi:hypothetical protein